MSKLRYIISFTCTDSLLGNCTYQAVYKNSHFIPLMFFRNRYFCKPSSGKKWRLQFFPLWFSHAYLGERRNTFSLLAYIFRYQGSSKLMTKYFSSFLSSGKDFYRFITSIFRSIDKGIIFCMVWPDFVIVKVLKKTWKRTEKI